MHTVTKRLLSTLDLSLKLVEEVALGTRIIMPLHMISVKILAVEMAGLEILEVYTVASQILAVHMEEPKMLEVDMMGLSVNMVMVHIQDMVN